MGGLSANSTRSRARRIRRPLDFPCCSPVSFQKEAATRLALGGIDHGDKVLVIGSRWQYLDILRGLRELMQDFGPARSQSSWRNRDLTVFPGDAPMITPPAEKRPWDGTPTFDPPNSRRRRGRATPSASARRSPRLYIRRRRSGRTRL